MLKPTQRNWSPKKLLSNLHPSMFDATPELVESRREKLWRDLYAEYDARHFAAELSRRDVIQTESAKAFFAAWDEDERKHTDGFVFLMELVTKSKPSDLWQALDGRPHSFSVIAHYMRDEFSVLALIAFDEIATCQGYAASKPFYDSLGGSALVDWLREVIADEAAHCANAMRVIRGHHAHRIPELPALLEALIALNPDQSSYQGTFVLDHFGPEYSVRSLSNCRDRLLKAAGIS